MVSSIIAAIIIFLSSNVINFPIKFFNDDLTLTKSPSPSPSGFSTISGILDLLFLNLKIKIKIKSLELLLFFNINIITLRMVYMLKGKESMLNSLMKYN